MTEQQHYCLQATTIAVYWNEGKGQHTHIPAGAILSRARTPEDCFPFVEVLWNSRFLKMFAEDFQKRAQLVSS